MDDTASLLYLQTESSRPLPNLRLRDPLEGEADSEDTESELINTNLLSNYIAQHTTHFTWAFWWMRSHFPNRISCKWSAFITRRFTFMPFKHCQGWRKVNHRNFAWKNSIFAILKRCRFLLYISWPYLQHFQDKQASPLGDNPYVG
jgi:hypothetical protein